MRILIAGDTHGDEVALLALKKAAQHVDRVLFTGDFYRDAKHIRADAIAVCGNTDVTGCKDQERTLDIMGLHVFLTHGHRYQVKAGLGLLQGRCAKDFPQLAVYGHTHLPEAIMVKDVLYINPGSASLPRGGYPASYALLDIHKEETFQVRVEHRQLSGIGITGLKQTFTLRI